MYIVFVIGIIVIYFRILFFYLKKRIFMLLDMLCRIIGKKYANIYFFIFKIEELKLYSECVVYMKNIKFVLSFIIVYVVWKLWVGILK